MVGLAWHEVDALEDAVSQSRHSCHCCWPSSPPRPIRKCNFLLCVIYKRKKDTIDLSLTGIPPVMIYNAKRVDEY
jgi:hypothetical protein